MQKQNHDWLTAVTNQYKYFFDDRLTQIQCRTECLFTIMEDSYIKDGPPVIQNLHNLRLTNEKALTMLRRGGLPYNKYKNYVQELLKYNNYVASILNVQNPYSDYEKTKPKR